MKNIWYFLKCKEKEFLIYVLLICCISKEVFVVICLIFDGNNLCYKGEVVLVVFLFEVFIVFLNFLDFFNYLIIVGYNI